MPDLEIGMQRQTRLQEGLALTWDAVPGAIRYGFVVGYVNLPVPSLDAIMRGASPGFAVMGIPPKFSGAVDLGTPAGEERQYGLVAYRTDGTIVNVDSVLYCGARGAPRDREYHLLQPPPLVRPAGAPEQLPSQPTPRKEPDAATVITGPVDPWAALEPAARAEAATAKTETPASLAERLIVSPVVERNAGVPQPTEAHADPWALLPSTADSAAVPAESAPVSGVNAQPVPDRSSPTLPGGPPASGQGSESAGQVWSAPAALAATKGDQVLTRPVEDPAAAEREALEVTALLDEGEMYLLPQWADHAAAERLFDEAGRRAPDDARLAELRERLREAREAESARAFEAATIVPEPISAQTLADESSPMPEAALEHGNGSAAAPADMPSPAPAGATMPPSSRPPEPQPSARIVEPVTDLRGYAAVESAPRPGSPSGPADPAVAWRPAAAADSSVSFVSPVTSANLPEASSAAIGGSSASNVAGDNSIGPASDVPAALSDRSTRPSISPVAAAASSDVGDTARDARVVEPPVAAGAAWPDADTNAGSPHRLQAPPPAYPAAESDAISPMAPQAPPPARFAAPTFTPSAPHYPSTNPPSSGVPGATTSGSLPPARSETAGVVPSSIGGGHLVEFTSEAALQSGEPQNAAGPNPGARVVPEATSAPPLPDDARLPALEGPSQMVTSTPVEETAPSNVAESTAVPAPAPAAPFVASEPYLAPAQAPDPSKAQVNLPDVILPEAHAQTVAPPNPYVAGQASHPDPPATIETAVAFGSPGAPPPVETPPPPRRPDISVESPGGLEPGAALSQTVPAPESLRSESAVATIGTQSQLKRSEADPSAPRSMALPAESRPTDEHLAAEPPSAAISATPELPTGTPASVGSPDHTVVRANVEETVIPPAMAAGEPATTVLPKTWRQTAEPPPIATGRDVRDTFTSTQPEIGPAAAGQIQAPASTPNAGADSISFPSPARLGGENIAGPVPLMGVTQPPEAISHSPRPESSSAPSPVPEMVAPEPAAEVEASGDVSEPEPLSSPEVAALLDEAEFYLLPQWADYDSAARLIDQASLIAPADRRVTEMRKQLSQLQMGGSEQVEAWLDEAEQCLRSQDYWRAVDLFEQVQAQQVENDTARRGLDRARMLGRWSAQMTGAGSDAEQLKRVGDDFAAKAPDLAATSYAAAFGVHPTIVGLRGWLLALAESGQLAAVSEAAAQGVQTLRQNGRVVPDGTQDAGLARLRDQVATRDGIEDAVSQLVEALVAAAAPPHI